MADLCGDPVGARSVALFAGNQYMVLPELVAGFRRRHPEVGSVFYETLPPGVVLAQVRSRGQPRCIEKLLAEGLVGEPVEYASNESALLVAASNPAGISGLADLGRPGVGQPDPVRRSSAILQRRRLR